MTDYDKIISQWQQDVVQYCRRHNILSMDLRNLRTGDVYDYALYATYKQVKDAIEAYHKTPSSIAYAAETVRAIKQWYVATADNKLQKMSMKVISNNMFTRLITRTK